MSDVKSLAREACPACRDDFDPDEWDTEREDEEKA
jgi:hypothetical protein